MVEARVKESYRLPSAQSAGLEFVKVEWRAVPSAAEEEVKAAKFLEVRDGPEPDEFEPEVAEQPEEEPRDAVPSVPEWALDIQNHWGLESSGEIVFLEDDQILEVDGVGPATLEKARKRYPFSERE